MTAQRAVRPLAAACKFVVAYMESTPAAMVNPPQRGEVQKTNPYVKIINTNVSAVNLINPQLYKHQTRCTSNYLYSLLFNKTPQMAR